MARKLFVTFRSNYKIKHKYPRMACTRITDIVWYTKVGIILLVFHSTKWDISYCKPSPLYQTDRVDMLSCDWPTRQPPAVCIMQAIHFSYTWALMRFKLPVPRLFVKQFVQADIKETMKAPHYWPFEREPADPNTKDQQCGQRFHVMMSSCYIILC